MTQTDLLLVVFWQTWWFNISINVVIAGTAFILYKVRMSTSKHNYALLQQRYEECNELLNYAKESEQKAKEEVELSTRSKSVLLSKLSHEIRTPMNGVIGMASLLLETPLDAEQKEYTETITESSEALMTVINDMLITDVIDYSDAGAGKIELENKDFDLRSTIEDILELFAAKAAHIGFELLYRMEENVPSQIVGDMVRLRQVLMNLIENAVRFTSKGEILVGVEFLGSVSGNQIDLGFEVRDTGIALPPEEIELLSKDISNISSRDDGNGLGLVICKKLVSLMGGNLQMERKQGADTGNVFKFKIRARLSLQPIRSNLDYNPALDGKRIMLVDDNATHQSIIKKQLELLRLNVISATSGKQAIEILSKKDRVHLILMDMDMPGMNGIETAQFIQENYPAIPQILLSTKGDERYKEFPGLFKSVLQKPLRQHLLYKYISDELYHTAIIPTEQQNGKPKVSEDFSKRYPLQILLAEDNKTNQQIALKMLSKLGYKADLAENGQEALEMVGDAAYDLIFMDVQMPEMDGLEATRMMRLCLSSQPIIIAMTANAMQGDKQICLQAGMDDYISKPIKIEEVIKMLEKWAVHVKDKS